MITNRLATKDDYNILSESLSLDEFHKDTSADYFFEEGTVCTIYEDDDGIILFVRGKPVVQDGIGIIQLDIQYRNNFDARRNMKAMLEGFPELERKAKENGFSGFFVVSNVPLLRKFCIKRLGFEPLTDEYLIKVLVDKSSKDVIE